MVRTRARRSRLSAPAKAMSPPQMIVSAGLDDEVERAAVAVAAKMISGCTHERRETASKAKIPSASMLPRARDEPVYH